MEYEIDYIPVGEKTKGGDAIALRYGDLNNPSNQSVVVIDGGTKESGEEIVKHIKKFYKTNFIDLVVSTHLHQDHASGLTEILNEFDVGKLAMHLPWDHAANIKSMFDNGKIKTSTLETSLEKSLSIINELKEIAVEKNIEIVEPFVGTPLLNNLFVLGPSKDYYELLLANFENTPKIKEEFKVAAEKTKIFAEKAISWIREEMGIETETLKDDEEDTSPENNTSTVLLLVINEKKFLFTGDAGKEALYKVVNFAESLGVSLNDLQFLDMPHHGSRRNIEPSLLEKINAKKAFISAPSKGDPKHPSRKVVNALIRRQTAVFVNNNGVTICSPSENAPDRGWSQLSPAKFNNLVED